ncbi:hypothetical protein GCM10008940_11920 [Microbulbifer agarilyticus]
MGNGTRNHWAYMHVSDSRCWFSHIEMYLLLGSKLNSSYLAAEMICLIGFSISAARKVESLL